MVMVNIATIVKRLRCLAHLIRKARRLQESSHPQAAQFGEKVLEILSLFIKSVYDARGDPDLDLLTQFSSDIKLLKELCEQHLHHSHLKTRQLSREFLNDWDAIWAALSHIDTCRQHDISPWPYIASVISVRRQGLPPPPFTSSFSLIRSGGGEWLRWGRGQEDILLLLSWFVRVHEEKVYV